MELLGELLDGACRGGGVSCPLDVSEWVYLAVHHFHEARDTLAGVDSIRAQASLCWGFPSDDVHISSTVVKLEMNIWCIRVCSTRGIRCFF